MSVLFLFGGCPEADVPDSAGDSIIDQDGDGWQPPEDCDDLDPLSYPGAIDDYGPFDRIDQDCNGRDGPFFIRVLGHDYAVAGDVDRDGRMDLVVHTSVDTSYRTHLFFSSHDWEYPADLSFYEFNARGVGDLDGDSLVEIAAVWRDTLYLYLGADLVNVPVYGWPEPSVSVPVPAMANASFRLLGDIDADGDVLIQVGEYVMPRDRLVEPGFDVGQAPWHFPDLALTLDGGMGLSFGPTMQSGDLDGDGLVELLVPDVLFPGALLAAGGTFPIADGEQIPGLGGILGDVSGDGLDDAWVYEATAYGAVHLVSAPLVEGTAPPAFATIVGSADLFLPAAAGGIGDADQDGRADVGTGVGPVLRGGGYEGDTHLFRGARLSGTLDLSDHDRRITYYAATFDHVDFDGDGLDDPVLADADGHAGVVGGAELFPTP